MNQVMLIGKLVMIGDYFLKVDIIDKSKGNQIIPIEATETMMRLVQENGRINGVIGVKGYIEVDNEIKIKAEKITFLSWN